MPFEKAGRNLTNVFNGYRYAPKLSGPDAKSPAEVMIGRPIRIELDTLLKVRSHISHEVNHSKWIPGVGIGEV